MLKTLETNLFTNEIVLYLAVVDWTLLAFLRTSVNKIVVYTENTMPVELNRFSWLFYSFLDTKICKYFVCSFFQTQM